MANDSLAESKKKLFDKRCNQSKPRGIKGLPKFLKNVGDFARAKHASTSAANGLTNNWFS